VYSIETGRLISSFCSFRYRTVVGQSLQENRSVASVKHVIVQSKNSDDDDDRDERLLKMTRPSESYVMERSFVSASPPPPPRAVAGTLAPRI